MLVRVYKTMTSRWAWQSVKNGRCSTGTWATCAYAVKRARQLGFTPIVTTLEEVRRHRTACETFDKLDGFEAAYDDALANERKLCDHRSPNWYD